MKKTLGWTGLALVAAGLCLSGCESDSSISQYTFRNQSSHQVSVRIRNTTAQTDSQFTLATNGATAQIPEFMSDPLTYTYAPTATVSDRRDGSDIIFENR